MSDIEIALFPIPGSVSLPFDTVPLHVFEPRYRQMIQDSIAMHRRIGVTHTRGTLSPSKVSVAASREEVLSSNHATYKAQPVFSAGFADIVQTLPDGRLLVQIRMDSRYELVSELQDLPYKIARCRLFKDEREESDTRLRADVDRLLVFASGEQSAKVEALLSEAAWVNLSLFEYSFRIYSLIDLEPDMLQRVLELRSINDRMHFMKNILQPPVLN